ncbi:ERF family protein [Phascolarctobacterium faecium]|uniref:ERF family protein n=1 Tax=Phascolarctobacterium faecium TaxID=33025 RepID=UPI003AB40328
MKIYIYDIEVFAHDWFVVFSDLEEKEIVVFHNDNVGLKRFMLNHGLIFGGFNNKHYDDWVTQSMLTGADPEIVKAHNDFIIQQHCNGWEFPFVQFQRKLFKSFDLRDDIADKGLSLKAIEGNMCEPIVESSIDFNIKRKLTAEEVEEVIFYCKTDVSNSVKLYHKRKSYLDGKIAVGRLKGIDASISLSLTNPKLTATYLEARRADYNDEFEYEPPAELILNKYREPIEFFRKIDYNEKLKCDIAGVQHVYGWGGIHGARENYFDQSTEEMKIVDIDVGSYYPSMMLEYGYISRSIPSAEGYANVHNTRIKAKHEGDDETAGALKLVLNSTYGAMKNQYNPLYDPRGANHICITGQLLLTDLIEKLEDVEGFSLIQSNTDGLMIKFPVANEKQINKIVEEWEQRTRLNMEYTEIHRIAQKDVNNYIVQVGATYLIRDGVKTFTKEDKLKINTKGGYVSLWQGGSFKNNSLIIVHKAIVEYFMNSVPVEDTINKAENIFDFQMICKTGGTFQNTVWAVGDDQITVQRVNRVYAVKDQKYGLIYKVKDGRLHKMPDVPEHCYVDNTNCLKIADIDRSFYIELAKKRIADFLGNTQKTKKKRKEVEKMATAKTENYSDMNVYKKLQMVRMDFANSNVKKSGVNRFAEYKYFELADIVPTANMLFAKYSCLLVCAFDKGFANGILYNTDSPDECICFGFEMKQLDIISAEGKRKMNEMQALGSEITYARRYLYQLVLDIVENDSIEPTIGADADKEVEKPKAGRKPPATAADRKQAVEELTGAGDKEVECTKTQITAIKNGLKKLRETEGDYESYITETVGKIKAGMTKKAADTLLIEIGEKIAKAGV